MSRGFRDIVILDKEPGINYHASGRNSGVLHAGIYYNTDSLKAQFCIDGNHHWQQFCDEKNLEILKTGKLLVAKNKDEVSTLEALYEQAKTNGAKVDLISESETSQFEPLAKPLIKLYFLTTQPCRSKKMFRYS